MRKILVPMDGSGSAMRALACALTLGNVLKEGEIHLLNVRLPLMDFDIATGGDPSAIEQASAMHLTAGTRLLESAITLLDRADVRHIEAVRMGEPAGCIADYAREIRCDAIVMGTRGLGPVAGLVMGSVAVKVVHLVDMPVTLVK
jgi:nucleotide-binding universal stress UspA family protein